MIRNSIIYLSFSCKKIDSSILAKPFAAEVCSFYGIKNPLVTNEEAWQFLQFFIGKTFEMVSNDDHQFHSKEYKRVDLIMEFEELQGVYISVRDIYIAAGFKTSKDLINVESFKKMQKKIYSNMIIGYNKMKSLESFLLEKSKSSKDSKIFKKIAEALNSLPLIMHENWLE